MKHKIKNTLIITTRIATVLFLTLTLFISCQKNNDKEPEDEPSIINKQDLIGTWAFNANNYVYKDCVEKSRLVFSEKEVTEYFYNFDKKKNECFNMVWTMSYRLSGDKIILKHSNGATLTNKIELSGNELRLTYFDSRQMVTHIYTRLSSKEGSNSEDYMIKDDKRKNLPHEVNLPDYGKKWWNGRFIYEVITDMPMEKMKELAKKVEGGKENFKLNKGRNKNENLSNFNHYVIFNSLSEPNVAIEFNGGGTEMYVEFALKSGEYLPLYNQEVSASNIKIYCEGIDKRYPYYIQEFHNSCDIHYWKIPKALYFHKVIIKRTYIYDDEEEEKERLYTMYFLVNDIKYIDLIYKKIGKFYRAYKVYDQKFLGPSFYVKMSKCHDDDRDDYEFFKNLWGKYPWEKD